MLNRIKNIEGKNKVLIQNTFMLYLLQFSTYFFSLVTVPYQTRVLGPEIYGLLGFSLSVMAYFQMFLDFGFMLSATADVSRHRNEKEYLERKLTSVNILKLIFVSVSTVIIIILCSTIDIFKQDPLIFYLAFAGVAFNCFMPDFLYRGIENMTPITIRALLIKVFFTAMIFVFLRTEADYYLVPLLTLIGNAGAVFGAYLHVFKKLKIRFRKIAPRHLKRDFLRGLGFFYSRIATTVYGATNTLIVGIIDNTGATTGYYTSADKVLQTAKNCLSPISDSLYPYMVKHKNFALVKKILLVFMPVIILGCAVVGIFAEPLCIFAFGEEYGGTAPILQAMLPTIAVILPSYILGFPTLTAMGKAKYANLSVIAGTVVHILGIVIMLLTNSLSPLNLAIMVSVSESAILIFRLIVVLKNRNIFKKGE